MSEHGVQKDIVQKKFDALSNHIHIVESRGDPKEYYKRSTDVIKTLQDQIFDFEKKIVQAKVIIRYYRF